MPLINPNHSAFTWHCNNIIYDSLWQCNIFLHLFGDFGKFNIGIFPPISIFVTDFANQPGFEYGPPPENTTPWYALWSPVLDCFVMVSYDLYLLQQIQLLTTSKIPLRIIKLSAKFYQTNIIDNLCCHNWSVKDLSNINFNTLHHRGALPLCDEIRPVVSMHPDCLQFRSWVIFLAKWIRYLQTWDNHYIAFATKVLDYENPRHVVIQKIYRALLFGERIDETEIVIQNIIKDHRLPV